jgi:hypothetical protein
VRQKLTLLTIAALSGGQVWKTKESHRFQLVVTQHVQNPRSPMSGKAKLLAGSLFRRFVETPSCGDVELRMALNVELSGQRHAPTALS